MADSAPYKLLFDWGDVCAQTDAEQLAATVAGGFLVCRPSSALQVPEKPQATMRVNVKMIEAAKRGEFHRECPAWALRRSEESVYSFISVGRTDNCDVTIPDESISKLHAIIRDGGAAGFTVQDAGSRNKTFVDGIEAPRRGAGDPIELRSGTEIRFGAIETVYFTADDFYRLAITTSRNP
jgi:hypothetical protein